MDQAIVEERRPARIVPRRGWVLAAALMAHYVYSDARARGASNPVLWAAGTFLLAIVFLPAWLLTRPRHVPATDGPRRCPFCVEAVQPAAAVCMHCGKDLPPRS